jgi:HEAT repeat protein
MMMSHTDEFWLLMDALNGETAHRTQAQRRLTEMGSVIVEALLEILRSERHSKSWAIVQVLGDIGDPRCLPDIVSALHSHNPLLSSAAVKSLSKFQSQTDIIPTLLEVLPTSNIMTQQSIVVALQQLGDSRVVSPLIQLLYHAESPVLRCAVIQTLGKLGDQAAVPAIRSFQDDSDHHVREWVNVALRQLESPTAP